MNNQLSLLLLDDDVHLGAIYKQRIEATGCARVTVVRDSVRARDAAMQQLFDVIVIDAKLPYRGDQFGGMRLADELRARYGKDSIIIVSQFITESELRVHGGDFEFIDKSFAGDIGGFAKHIAMVAQRLKRRQYAFVAMPFAAHFRDLYTRYVKPGFQAAGLKCLRADDVKHTQPMHITVSAKEVSMKMIQPFCQNELIAEDSLGICTRITFKWLALEIGNGEFKYENMDVRSSTEKNAKYCNPFIHKLCEEKFSADDKRQADNYVRCDLKSMTDFVNNDWGKRVSDSQKKRITGIRAGGGEMLITLSSYVQDKVKKSDWSSFHALLSFYRKKPATVLQAALGADGKMLGDRLAKVQKPERTIMTGHVVGISGSTNRFFDCNHGLYHFEEEDPWPIAKEIESHIAINYPGVFRLGLVLLRQ
jgi:CheY-like chemotaxis protein